MNRNTASSGTPCFQHDSYRPDCGDCRDMNKPLKVKELARGLYGERRFKLEEPIIVRPTHRKGAADV